VLQASTSEVYGDPLEHPQKESYWGNVNPIGPRACYDEGKRAAETLFFDYWRVHGVDVRVARIFNTYGPGMREDDGRVVSNFICQALRGEPLTVYGDGRQTRSLCYVSDTIDALMQLMAAKQPLGPVNVGNPVECTVGSIAMLVLRLTDSGSGFEMRKLPQDDPCRRRPDISVMKALGWSPKVALIEGLQKTIDHFRAQLARPHLEKEAA
jgi:UDP-glucuronate decarboxylase